MLVPISQLKPGENSLLFLANKESWVRDLVTQVEKQSGNRVTGEVQISLQLTKLEPEYYLKGKLAYILEQNCARCAEGFQQAIQHPFEISLNHLPAGEEGEEELVPEAEELDVNFFQGNEIDLKPILEEQFFLSFPYQAVCKPDCLGLCSRCGQNRNLSKCKCDALPKTGPFSELAKLKGKLNKH